MTIYARCTACGQEWGENGCDAFHLANKVELRETQLDHADRTLRNLRTDFATCALERQRVEEEIDRLRAKNAHLLQGYGRLRSMIAELTEQA